MRAQNENFLYNTVLRTFYLYNYRITAVRRSRWIVNSEKVNFVRKFDQ